MMVVGAAMAAARVPLQNRPTPHGTYGHVKVGMSVDPSRDDELPPASCTCSPAGDQGEGDFGDPTVGSGGVHCGSLASSVDHHSTSYQHDRILCPRDRFGVPAKTVKTVESSMTRRSWETASFAPTT